VKRCKVMFSGAVRLKALALLVLLGAVGGASVSPAAAFKFGVMADTQWTHASDSENPNSVAVSIINQVDPQFISEGVKFVVQVGDITDNGSTAAVTTHAQTRQRLIDAGIGYFPLRGNHEGGQTAGIQFVAEFPQTQGITNTFGAINFSSPDPDSNGNLTGLSYAFEYEGHRFVMLDQFTRLSGTTPSVNDAIADQLPWIETVLAGRTNDSHAFVFAHKNLIGQNHVDSLLGSDPADNPDLRNAFIGLMDSNKVGYVMGGHDHVHQFSLIESPDGLSETRQIICASDSSKFYTPSLPSNDEAVNNPPRELSISQDLYRIGYYIFTVDGAQVTVEYYASDEYFPSGNSPSTTPALHFALRETFGYNLNGKEFLVSQGESYTNVVDSVASGGGFSGTSAAILAGTNGSTRVDGSDRATTKYVTTGWTPDGADENSDVLRLMGMADVGEASTDTFVLSMGYQSSGLTTEQLEGGLFALCTKNSYGRWIRAVDANIGGSNTFVLGAWNGAYGLGAYGVDTNAESVWAVINHNSEFAAAVTHIPAPGYIAGDFHQHSLHTDGSFPMQTVFSNSALYGLDWWANSEHGGIQKSDFRWKDIGGYAIPTGLPDTSWGEVRTGRDLHATKTIIQGLELNCPAHEHVSTAIITDQYPEGTNLSPMAEFEYRFDGNDSDTSGGPGGIWTGKSVTNDHAKAVAAVAWLQANYPQESWFVPAHPERVNAYTIAHFRDFNNAGPDVAFGFESMPGHQKSSGRGGYGTSAGVPPMPTGQGGTYGGTGAYAAQVGGIWDALLGEGRRWWLFASSDFHSTGGDYWPGEYQKTYSYVDDAAVVDSDEATQQIVDSLRSGNSWVVQGDLIDTLEFTAAGADMGSSVFVNDDQVTVSIQVHDPEGQNFGPEDHNTPTLDHIDVIAGDFGGPIATNDEAYSSAINASARIVARFDAVGGITDTNGLTSLAWTDLGGGIRQMSMTFDAQGQSTYFRLRGSNLGMGVTNETDGAGNPLADSLMGANDATKPFDDLWFYSNPVYVQINQSPVISITSPTNGTEITEGYTVSIEAGVSDDGDMASVSFYANGNLLDADTLSPFVYNWADATVGAYDLTAVALDAHGLSATSAVVSISVVAAESNYDDVSNVVIAVVGDANDDAEEDLANGAMDITSSDLELIQDGSKLQRVGVRFASVDIPKGKKILSAYVQFTCDETKTVNPFNVTVYGEAADAASTYAASASNITSRTQTTNNVAWTGAPDWTIIGEAGLAQRTPNLAVIVQEIIDREGWVEGGPIALMFDGEGCRCAEAADSGLATAPKLVVVAVDEADFGVDADDDDMEESVETGELDVGSSDLEITHDKPDSDQIIGVRFASVVIPEGVELVNAYIQFTCDEIGAKNISPFNVSIRAEAAANPATYAATNFSVSSRVYSSNAVEWTGAPDWTIVGEAGPAQRTPNLKGLILERMTNGWVNGNAMAFKFTGAGGRCAEARESGAETAPKLVLQYAGTEQGGDIGLASNSLDFVATYAGADPAAQLLTLTNGGLSGLRWTNTISYSASSNGWLTVTPQDGTLAQGGATSLTVSASITGLNVGTYYATNVISSADATNSPQTIVVSLTIGKAAQTISFPNPDMQSVTNETPITATASSGLPVSLTVVSGVDVVVGPIGPTSPILLTYQNPGLVTLRATQGGNDNWLAAAAVEITFRVRPARVPYADFDGDGRSDLTVYWPFVGRWYHWYSMSGEINDRDWGWSAVTPVPADYDGDGVVDLAVYHQAQGMWYIHSSDDKKLIQRQFGWFATEAVPGDYDGDGIADFAVHNRASGKWYIIRHDWTEFRELSFGWRETVPVPADYDGDGITDIAVYWPRTGRWHIVRSSDSAYVEQDWGFAEALPVPADYDGDGIADLAVYWPRTGTWYIHQSTDRTTRIQPFGSGAKPVPGDFDGDGLDDIAVYEQGEGRWSILQSTGGYITRLFGWSEALPPWPSRR